MLFRSSITGGEPTLSPELLGLIRFASKKGFSSIKVQSNGLVFAQAANLERCIAVGLDQLNLSVHSYDGGLPTAYELVTGETGSQDLLLQAIDNALRSKVKLEIDLILMRSTLGSVIKAIEALGKRGVRVFNLWLVSLTDNNAKNEASLPPLSELLPVVEEALDKGRENHWTVRSLHLPRCLLPGREDQVSQIGRAHV